MRIESCWGAYGIINLVARVFFQPSDSNLALNNFGLGGLIELDTDISYRSCVVRFDSRTYNLGDAGLFLSRSDRDGLDQELVLALGTGGRRILQDL
jgi:hypothetical protein